MIFVSIDDSEVANLRQVMDEIFGEENFIAQFVWKQRISREQAADTSAFRQITNTIVLTAKRCLQLTARGLT